MTQGQVHDFPYYRSPNAIRNEAFSHRMRGLDEAEVREYLDLLADQVHAADKERAEIRAENERLRNQIARVQAEHPDGAGSEVNPDSIALFSHAQQVADQLVEEAVVHARDLMASARNQEREILQQAHEAAQKAARGVSSLGVGAAMDYSTPISEIEYVRTFTQVAQVQLRSVLEALGEQVERLGEVPNFNRDGGTHAHVLDMRTPHHPG